jgi:hypothetical protein
MQAPGWGLVEIVRDFLTSYQTMMRLGERYRDGSLRFSEIESFVGDAESCVLFRLKERCHALFRYEPGSSDPVMWREALFDLAVGSLFHEAMKFRENLYQHEVYAPRVRSLRREADEHVDEFLVEFERILAVSATRLNESLLETEALFDQTRRQLLLLLVHCRDDGLVARCLLERESQVGEVFPRGLDALLSEMYGDVGAGYRAAAESYLGSAHFAEVVEVLEELRARAGDHPDLARLRLYAEGMRASDAGLYECSLQHLGAWLDAGPEEGEAPYIELAHAAVRRIPKLAEGMESEESRSLAVAAEALAKRLSTLTAVGDPTGRQAPRADS